jgi:hypothetical protein
MPFNAGQPQAQCPICQSQCNIVSGGAFCTNADQITDDPSINCTRCGDFIAEQELVEDWPAHGGQNTTTAAIASNVIRQLQAQDIRPTILRNELLKLIEGRALSTPAGAADNLILLVGDALRDRPGTWHDDYWVAITARLGLRSAVDAVWLTKFLVADGRVEMQNTNFDATAGNALSSWSGRLTFLGWSKYNELTQRREEGRFAFFARKFDNPDLDAAHAQCLRPAVQKTGYDLRTVKPHAGLIDAIIEHEIRICKFLIVDLTDGNAGAYWEAGLAEGLRKPVFYVCRDVDSAGAKLETHFDTSHRTTIRWSVDPAKRQRTEDELKAVIRNTLLGDALQKDP